MVLVLIRYLHSKFGCKGVVGVPLSPNLVISLSFLPWKQRRWTSTLVPKRVTHGLVHPLTCVFAQFYYLCSDMTKTSTKASCHCPCLGKILAYKYPNISTLFTSLALPFNLRLPPFLLHFLYKLPSILTALLNFVWGKGVVGFGIRRPKKPPPSLIWGKNPFFPHFHRFLLFVVLGFLFVYIFVVLYACRPAF